MPRIHTLYSDSAGGAIQYLKENSQGLNLRGANAFPDPVVEGVWAVDLKDGRRVIVWLAGYPDVLGYIRKDNDFEVEE